MGVTSQYRKGKECSQLVICNKLNSAHPSLVKKAKEYFLRTLEYLANSEASISTFYHTGQNMVMASYKVAYRVALVKKHILLLKN